MNANSILKEVKAYVGTYAKYNSGDLSGQWVDVSDFDNMEDFLEACRKLHADEKDLELMFQDWDIPEEKRGLWRFVDEGYIHPDLFLLADVSEDEEYILAHLSNENELSEEEIQYARDNYVGYFESYAELGRELVDMGMIDLPKEVENYFDYERYGEDCSYDLHEVDGYYFWNK